MYGPGTGHRVNRRYCSMKCQEAAYYRRKKERQGAFWRQQVQSKKNRRPVRGGGLAAEGTKVPLFQFYQSTWKRVPKPLTVAPSKPFLAVIRLFPRSAGVVE